MRKIVVFLSVFIFLGCSNRNQVVRMTDFALGTVCSITLYDSANEKYLAPAFKLIDEYEDKISKNLPGSEIYCLNENAGKSPVKISPDVFALLKIAVEYGRISGGLFDLTIDPVVELWGIGTEHASVPPEDKLRNAVSKVDYRKLILDDENKSAYLPEVGLGVDLGGIAKGYIGDRVEEFLKGMNVSGGILDLGGTILVFGKKPDGTDFRIGIQDPFQPRGNYLGIVSIEKGTVVTSGIYERYFEENGKKYHHIFDVRNGYPVENELAGVSIITMESAMGDALSTSVFALGLDAGKALVESMPDVEAVFITREHEVIITSGLAGKFVMKQ